MSCPLHPSKMNIFLSWLAVIAPLLSSVEALDPREQRCVWAPASGEEARDAAGALKVDIIDIQKQNKDFTDPDVVYEGHHYTVPCTPTLPAPATWSFSSPSTYFLRLNGFTVPNEPTSTMAPFLPSSVVTLLPPGTTEATLATPTTPSTRAVTSTRRFRWM